MGTRHAFVSITFLSKHEVRNPGPPQNPNHPQRKPPFGTVREKSVQVRLHVRLQVVNVPSCCDFRCGNPIAARQRGRHSTQKGISLSKCDGQARKRHITIISVCPAAPGTSPGMSRGQTQVFSLFYTMEAQLVPGTNPVCPWGNPRDEGRQKKFMCYMGAVLAAIADLDERGNKNLKVLGHHPIASLTFHQVAAQAAS